MEHLIHNSIRCHGPQIPSGCDTKNNTWSFSYNNTDVNSNEYEDGEAVCQHCLSRSLFSFLFFYCFNLPALIIQLYLIIDIRASQNQIVVTWGLLSRFFNVQLTVLSVSLIIYIVLEATYRTGWILFSLIQVQDFVSFWVSSRHSAEHLLNDCSQVVSCHI